MARKVKHLSTVWETWVRSLGWEDSLEKEMATHSSTSCLEDPMDGGAWCRLLSMRLQRVGDDWVTSLHFPPPLLCCVPWGASLVAQTVSICLQCERPGFDPWVGKIPWRRKWQSTPVLLALKIPCTVELGAGYYAWSRKELGTTERLHFTILLMHS